MSATRKLRKLFTLLRSRGGFEEDIGLVRRRATTRIENDPGIGELDIAGIFRLDYFPAKNADVEVLRFFLIFHGEEMRDEKAFVGNRRVRQIHVVSERAPSGPGDNK